MHCNRFAIILATVLLSASLAACGDDDAAESPDVTMTTPSDSPTTATPTTDASTTDAPTTETPATDAPATTEPSIREVNDRCILGDNQAYTTGTTAIGSDITFTTNDAARFCVNLPGFFAVSTQASGDETLMYFLDLSTATVFKDPFADYAAMGRDNTQLFAATEPIPGGDFLEYFRQLPGVTTGEIADATMLGQPARSMTFTVGSNEGGHAVPPDTEPLMLTFFAAAGITQVYVPGDSGTLYVLEFGGKPLLVEVSNYDGAAEFAATAALQP